MEGMTNLSVSQVGAAPRHASREHPRPAPRALYMQGMHGKAWPRAASQCKEKRK